MTVVQIIDEDNIVAIEEVPTPVTVTTSVGVAGGFAPVPFSRSGTLTVLAGAGRFYVPYAAAIVGVTAAVGTAPTGASILADVNKNGTTVFTTQGNRPAIVATAFKTAAAAVPDVTALVVGDLLSVDVDQVGSTIAGADLTVVVLLRRTA